MGPDQSMTILVILHPCQRLLTEWFCEQILANESWGKDYEGILRKSFLVLRMKNHFYFLPLEAIKNTCGPSCLLVAPNLWPWRKPHWGRSLSMEDNWAWNISKKQSQSWGPTRWEVPTPILPPHFQLHKPVKLLMVYASLNKVAGYLISKVPSCYKNS